jgi:hypothetical protein
MNITGNGTYSLNDEVAGNSSSVFYVAGTQGPAVLQLKYFSNGTAYPFADGLFVTGDQYEVTHGVDIDLVLVVTGADGSTNLDVIARGLK